MQQGPGIKESMAVRENQRCPPWPNGTKTRWDYFSIKLREEKGRGSMRVKTKKVSKSESRGSGEDSELSPKYNEKAFMSFKFGCFECNKDNYLKAKGQNQRDDLRGHCCSSNKRWQWSEWQIDSGYGEEGAI